jgi:dipeptidyl aminopeptidase/acylaminoacyl peptidase
MRGWPLLWILASVALAIVGTLARGAELAPGTAGQPLSHDLAFTIKRLPAEERPALSPDGQWLAYSVRTVPVRGSGGDPPHNFHYLPNGTPRRMAGTQLYVTGVETGGTRLAGPASGSAWKPSWSPDSRRVAFFCDAGGPPQLWVYDVTKGTARKVSDVPLNPSIFPGDEPCWSTDGSELFVRLRPTREKEPQPEMGDPQPRASDGPAAMVYRSGEEVTRQHATQPSPAGLPTSAVKENAALAAVDVRSARVRTVVPAEATPSPGHLRLSASGNWVSYLSVFRQNHPVFFEGPCDLAIVRSSGGPVKVLATDLPFPGDYLGTYRWHPSQDLLVYRKEGQLWLVDLRGRTAPAPRQLAPELGHMLPEPLLFSRDGRALIARPLDRANASGPPSTVLALIPLDGGKPRTIALKGSEEFRGVLRANPQTAWQPRPGFLTAAFSRGDEIAIERIDLDSGQKVTLRNFHARFRHVGSGGDHRSLLAEFQDANTPPAIYRFSDDLSQQVRLTHVDPRLDGVRTGPVETYETSVPQYDGKMTQVKTAVLLPPGARRGDRLPTIVCVYGGDMLSGNATEFGGGIAAGIPALLFVTRGYAVILPDVPIEPEGAGRSPMHEMVDVLLPQIYHAADLGYTDIQRVGLVGHSYGGYSTAAILSQTHLFRAGVAISGVYDLPGLHGRMTHGDGPDFYTGLLEKGTGRMGTHPWADLTRYLANSPYYQADKIDTPLLLIHGERDGAAPAEESEKMYNALKRLGKTAQLATYAGEGHVPYEWSLVNAADAARRIVGFLDRYVRGGSPPH